MPKSQRLVIVESPAKARTISGYLGDGFVVESSIGHIRDLPRRAADVPAKYKKTSWGRLGVDVENDFAPLYVVDPDKKTQIAKIKKLLKESDELLLATDGDREGESIAWHLLQVLKPKVPVRRMVFHEITKKAILQALETSREIDQSLVEAQEARRILDRLYGYEVSPVLWKKVMPKLSAGRVQSVATRIIVNREQQRMAFQSASYWDITGRFATLESDIDFDAKLHTIDGQRLAVGKDFGSDGQLTKETSVVLDEARASALSTSLSAADFKVISVEEKPFRRSPAAPFMTSTLQQEAGRKLRFSAVRTMRTAQKLYEAGFITYMRTDSTTLSDSALNTARQEIQQTYGDEYLPSAPRVYRKKVKNAQEAHEAIRPAGDSFKSPALAAQKLGADAGRLYELIWKRTIGSQMADAKGLRLQAKLEGTLDSGEKLVFHVNGTTITFQGFLRAYEETTEDSDKDAQDKDRPLPPLREGLGLSGKAFKPEGHETQPPARFTEASLVRKLEELGVGRPSTYASIIDTIQKRGYVWKKGRALIPTFKAFAVVTLLENHFGNLVDYTFTARMEDELDAIATGTERSAPWLRRFYFGGGDANVQGVGELGLQKMVSERLGEIDAREINSIPIGVDDKGQAVVVRVGRYGPYLQRGEDTVSVPEDLAPDNLNLATAIEYLNAPSGDREIGLDPESGKAVLAKQGRFGAYVQLGIPEEGSKEKPKTSSLFSDMTVETIDLEQALRLLSLPREVGVDPADNLAITAQNGRYGPYIAKDKEFRSLESEAQIFSVSLEEALALLAQPKRSRRRAAAEPLRQLGDDAVSGKPILLKKGRFGPYVTDGETNASLRTGDDAETITPERAMELLQIRRDRGPTKKKKKKATKKKATKKKATKKKATKKKATKKKATEKKAD